MNQLFTRSNQWLVVGLYALLSMYVVYKQATDTHAISLEEQLARHERLLTGTSEFYNPWQYRILSVYVVEGFAHLAAQVGVSTIQAFLLFRFLQTVLLFWIAHLYWRALGIGNPWLNLCGMVLLCFSMAHSVFQSDLSFNTYFDILFYLLAGWLLLGNKLAWIIPLTAVAVLNRETSLLIPAMLLVTGVELKPFSWNKQHVWFSALAGLVFIAGFVAVRWYYGYQPAEGINGMRSVRDYLSFNLRFFTTYPELLGTLAVLPIVVLLFVKRLPLILQKWFWLICPVWFAVHFAYSTAVESRLFLVPQALIFIPAFLFLVEAWYKVPAPTDIPK
ncbi:MAG: hypothetical protein KF775_01670 [Cyclobacteriaceae bacterium]|nr:hypothetical protein [Cyclobacteriaceae bacterium]